MAVDNSVGLQHLAVLIANPGQEIHALDLTALQTLRKPYGEAAAPMSVQPVLDQQAERAYKDRLRDLVAELDNHDPLNDAERAAVLRLEHDWLVAELAAATGLAGRARRFTDDGERARIAVGKAIRRALTRITEADHLIGEELRATVETGQRCCYRPR
ncbi:hypothetical protein [Nonomuraea sp. NPDC050310]|uniref:hypothetical protein n=1 Tax=Nonomuraea sp. NPDC050310 TaxID=3154935 RepID=UPI0033F0B992